jgi:putative transcriptional regulator
MADTILSVVHETAQGLHDAGVMDAKTMREFDALCLPPVKVYSAEQIKRIRLRTRASQAVFAAYLNTSPSTGVNLL